MPKSRKTRTTSTDRRPSRAERKLRQLKRDVAYEAARILATEGQRNYRAAKEKAAERIGVSSRMALPSNLEVESALRDYQEIYGGEQHHVHLRSLREAALTVMRALQAFNPRLVGPVLEGTADRYSRISIHLFNDPPEQVALHLSERGVTYHQEERSIRWHDDRQQRLSLLVTEAAGHAVELVLLRAVDLRQSPPSPIDGRPQRRAALAEVEALLAEPSESLVQP